MTRDMKGKAEQSLQITIFGDADPAGSMKLTLEDGTSCTEADPKNPSKVKVLEPDDKTFRAEITGTLACGEGKKQVKYTALLNKAP